jgi:hypothetical protein
MTKLKLARSLSVFAAAAASALLAGQASAATAVVAVNPVTHTGACPFMFKFQGVISSPTPGVVKYQWKRSDGAIAPIQTLVFREPGRQIVTDTWTIGRTYAGWEALRLMTPVPGASNLAHFKLVCVNPLTGGPQP